MPRQKSSELTARQLQILRLAAGGMTYQEIADQLVRSPRTIEHVMERVYVKLGVVSRKEVAINAARERKLID